MIDLAAHRLHALGKLRGVLVRCRRHDHFTPSTVMPMLRALPAIVRTAASRSAGGQVGHLRLRDLLGLRAGQLADLVGVRLRAALVDLRRLLDQHRRGRRLHHEGEALVGERRDHHRNRQAGFELLRLRVERLAELHDVEAALAQRRPDRRARVRLARRHLQLDVTDDFLCHLLSPGGCKRTRLRPPRFIKPSHSEASVRRRDSASAA